MKKIIYNKYGGVDEMEMIETAIQETTDSTVLVQIRAVSVNPIDWKIREGQMKLMSGSKFPKGVGIDFSGVVEKTGAAITRFKKGDAVFGSIDQFKGGALAEYLLVAEKEIVLKPDSISFEKAAAIPVVGFAALQLFDKLISVQQGTEILINGASGGVGIFATQIAKMKGATVTAVVSEKGVALARKMGSDTVIDYQKTNILTDRKSAARSGSTPKLYDVVIDLSGKIPFDKAKTILKPSSTYVNTIPGPQQIIGSFFHNLFSKKKYKVLLSKPSTADLETLARYVNNGMDVVVTKTYPLQSFKQAYTEIPKGGIPGKAVITL